MKPNARSALGQAVDRFLRAMHRYDGGRTLPLLHALKLTTPQIAVLESAQQPRTVSAMAEMLGLSRPAASQMIDKLVRRGFVRRVEGAVDHRERNVVLTAKGKGVIQRLAAARAARFDASLAQIQDEPAQHLLAALEEVIAELRKES